MYRKCQVERRFEVHTRPPRVIVMQQLRSRSSHKTRRSRLFELCANKVQRCIQCRYSLPTKHSTTCEVTICNPLLCLIPPKCSHPMLSWRPVSLGPPLTRRILPYCMWEGFVLTSVPTLEIYPPVSQLFYQLRLSCKSPSTHIPWKTPRSIPAPKRYHLLAKTKVWYS